MSRSRPSLQMRQAAELRAMGLPLGQIAEQVGVSERSVEAWNTRPDFVAMVVAGENRVLGQIASGVDDFAESLTAGAQEMVELWRAMVRGEATADDDRIRLHVGPIVSGWFRQSFDFTEPAPSDAKEASATSTAAVQVNVNTGHDSP